MNELNNVAVFIDYENVYKVLLSQHNNLFRLGFFERLRVWCKNKGRRIVKIVAYCNFDNKDLYESYHQSKLHEYGVQTVHTSNRGKNYADIQLTIDVLDLMYLNDNINEFIIISNDKDMSPLINTIKANKRKVSLITASDQYDPLLNYIPDEILSIQTIIQETPSVQLKIEEDEKELVSIFENFSMQVYSEYLETGKFKHIDYDYTVGIYTTRFHLPRYEIANIISLQIKAGKAVIYRYNYNGREKQAIISEPTFEEIVKAKIINVEEKIDSNDINLTQNEYNKYIKPNRNTLD